MLFECAHSFPNDSLMAALFIFRKPEFPQVIYAPRKRKI